MNNGSQLPLKLLLVFLAMSVFTFFGQAPFSAQAQSGDAIAVRVLPNPEHYSPMTWYQKQGFKGSPTPIKVDGYEAVRDGRTVYVNVANIAGSDLYTNIYLISYNQEATPETLSIFDGILSKWRFNSNLTSPGKCSDEVLGASSDAKSCLSDSDCSDGLYCDSVKARLVRDIKRLGDIVDLREKVEEYARKYGKYPILSAGTYLPGTTVSTWPSWNTELANALGTQPPTDPVNRLGKCNGGDYDPVTCWNDQTKSFADADLADPALNLPASSTAMVYRAINNGESFEACAYMESGLLIDGSLGACRGSVNPNQAPTVECGSLMAIAGQPFEGYITARDVDDAKVDLTIYSIPSSFSVQNTESSASKRIYSSSVPSDTDYTFYGYARDEHSNYTYFSCIVKTQTEAFITYPVADSRVLVGKPINFSVFVNHSEGDYAGLTLTFNDSRLRCQAAPYRITDGRYKCDVSLTLTGPTLINATVSARNGSGDTSTQQSFRVEAYNNPPVMNALKCDTLVRVSRYPIGGAPNHYDYSCKLSAVDPDGHRISNYYASPLPANMSIVLRPDGTGELAGFPNAISTAGNYSVALTAVDEFGAVSAPVTLPLKIVDFCGDEQKQTPNMEGRGGPRNDGFEDCDDHSGTPWPYQSNISWQYGCNSSTCVSLRDGWCGDEKTQAGYGEHCDDGNTIDGDGCNTFDGSTPSCQWECGDGVVTPSYRRHEATREYNVTEQCDFGADTNCCRDCNWTTGPTRWVDIGGDSSLANGGTMTLSIPNCRGVLGGVFDATPKPYGSGSGPEAGTAIVFITDISGSAFDTSYASTKQTMLSSIQKFYNEANSKNVNIHVGTIATYDPAGSSPSGVYDVVNIGNLSDTYGGATKKTELEASINTYGPKGDQPNFAAAYSRAASMLNGYANAAPDEKYIIILTDGYPESGATESAAAKAAGIKIYNIAFSNWVDTWASNGGACACSYGICYVCRNLRAMCTNSSDNGNTSACYTNTYARRKMSASTDPAVVLSELNAMYDSIISQILSRVPTNIRYVVNGVTQNLSTYASVPFTPPNNCDISGQNPCNPSTFTLSTSFTGTGEIQFNNFKLNIIPLCE
jgi:cysteine-rich repeat protein